MLKPLKNDPQRTVSIWGKKIKTTSSFIYQLFKKLNNGYSPIVGICGVQRGGKSFVGVWLTYLLYKIRGLEYNFEKLTFYEPDKAMESLEEKNRDAMLIDEASDVIDYQEWYKQTHRALRSMVNTQAYKNNLYVFIAPFLVQINKSIRIHCDFEVRVTKRGVFKVWKIIKRYDADHIKNATYRLFLDDMSIKMSDVPKELWKQYKEFSYKKKEEIAQRRLENRDKKTKNKRDELIRLSKQGDEK